MRDHELELIAALVERRLDDESEARALIDSAPEYREEYEAQKQAYEALSETGPVTLSETERASLRRDVWTVLRAEAAPAPSGTPWYARWVPVAAGLFVVVGLVAVLSQGGGDDSGEETVGLAADTAETTSTAADTDTEADGEAAPSDEEQTATTSAAGEGEAAAESDDGADSGGAAALYSEEANKVRQRDFSGALDSVTADQARTTEIESCLQQLGIPDFDVVATLTPPTGTTDSTTGTTTATETARLMVAVPEEQETETQPVAFIDPETCELIHLDE